MKWFDRKFDFQAAEEPFETLERLKEAPVALSILVTGAHEEMLARRTNGKWSVKEHIGHLCVLEPLWRTRFGDIAENKPVLTAADLDNKATFEGNFNQFDAASLLARFQNERNETMRLLQRIDWSDQTHTSLHPRLQQPMRYGDHAYFVAEHDAHHLEEIRRLISA